MSDQNQLDCFYCGHGVDAHVHIAPHPCRYQGYGSHQDPEVEAAKGGILLPHHCDCPGFVWHDKAEAYLELQEALKVRDEKCGSGVLRCAECPDGGELQVDSISDERDERGIRQTQAVRISCEVCQQAWEFVMSPPMQALQNAKDPT